jgi:hypothetical protein
MTSAVSVASPVCVVFTIARAEHTHFPPFHKIETSRQTIDYINGIATPHPAAYTLPMQKWEYKVVKRADVSEEQLNGLGVDGWELMSFVLPQCNIPGSFDEIDVEIVLRRALAE